MTLPRFTLAAAVLAGAIGLAAAQGGPHQHGAPAQGQGNPPAPMGQGMMGQGMMGQGMMGHMQSMPQMMQMMRDMMPMMERMQRATPEERAKLMEQMAPMMQSMMAQMRSMMGQAPAPAAPGSAAEAPSVKAFQEANDRMHRAMAVQFTGNADVDFARAMIPHHQGAIDMARIALQYGTSPEIKRLAESVIREQEREIAEMRDWLSKNAK